MFVCVAVCVYVYVYAYVYAYAYVYMCMFVSARICAYSVCTDIYVHVNEYVCLFE